MYRKRPNGWKKHLDFIIIDLLCLFCAYFTAYHIRHPYTNPFYEELYMTTAMWMLVIAFLTSVLLEVNKNILKRGYYVEFVSIVKNSFIVIVSTVFYLYLINESGDYSRITMVLTGVIFVFVDFIFKSLWKKTLRDKSGHGTLENSLVIVTTKNLLERTEENIKANEYGEYILSGIVVIDEDMVGQSVAQVPIIANADTVEEYICRSWVDEIFINIPSTDVRGEQWMETFAEMGITVHFRLMHRNDLNKRCQFIERIGKYTVLTTSVSTIKLRDSILKRTIDIIAGIVGCVITGILLMIFGPIIYLKSPGPIFFSQVRIGKNGQRFRIYKFRSMYMDAEERKKEMMSENQMQDGMMFKVAWDKRIIGSEKGPDKGIGNFIRKYSIDEWPQFYNILKGEMSLIGTRPPTVDEWDKYKNHHRARLATKPGLTGMWQVSGRSKITDFEEVVRLDMKYIKEWTIGMDIKILLQTIWVVFRREGAM